MYHIKEDKRSIVSCQMIYEGLKTLMAKKSIDEIYITELVNVSGVSRATFYRNFDHIIDVLVLKSDQVFELLMEKLKNYHAKHVVNRSSEFLVPFLEFFDAHTEIVELLLQAGRRDVLQDSLSKHINRMYPTYELLSEDPTNTWAYFVAIRSGITTNILVQWVKDKKKMPPRRLGELLFKEIPSPFSVDQFM